METPEQLADQAITELLDNAIGPRPREIGERLRSDIWQLIREAQLQMSRQSEKETQ